MIHCPFHTPQEEILQIGGHAVTVRRFTQHEGFSFAKSTIPPSDSYEFSKSHFRAFSVIMYVNVGTVSFHLPDQGYTDVSAGEWCLLVDFQNQATFSCKDEASVSWFECDAIIWETLWHDRIQAHSYQACINCIQREESLLFKGLFTSQMSLLLAKLWSNEGIDPSNRLKVASQGYELLSETLDAPEFLQKPQAEPCLHNEDESALKAAASYLERNLAYDHSIKELSRKVHLNEFKLKKGFREHYQTTVFGYLRKKRMEYARSCLLENGDTVLEVAHKVGYSNPSHFSRAFRESFGINPSELKRRVAIGYH